MRVLVTGAGGQLGRALVPLLETRHALRLSDVRPVETPHEFVVADVRRHDGLPELMAGVDVLVHTPAWHGIHLRERTEREFWELNVAGAFNALQAAVAAAVPKVVWLSSTAALQTEPNVYGFTKQLGEQLCAYHHRRHGLRCIILRPPAFGPRPRKQIGEGMLRRRTDRRDVLQAVTLAVENETIDFGAFAVWPDDPFSADDHASWPAAPLAVLERHVPNAARLVDRYGLDLPDDLPRHDSSDASRQLGYRPRHSFATFLRELAEHDARNGAAKWLAQPPGNGE